MLKFFIDSDCDFTLKETKELGVEMISMPYIIGEKTYYPYVDTPEVDFKEFYNILRGGVIPKTCALSPLDYVAYFEPHFANGDDIIYVHFSAAMSGTFNAMHLALEELKEKYPERKFYSVDTKAITCLGYAIAKEGIRLWKEGKSGEEIVKAIEDFRDHYTIYFYSDDLKFFAKSGRVSNFAAFMGGLIGLHPVISICDDGVMRSVAKGRGKRNTLKKLVEYMKEIGDEVEKHPIYLAHSDDDGTLDELESILKEELGNDIVLQRIMVNPTAGSHCGPNNVGLCFHSKRR